MSDRCSECDEPLEIDEPQTCYFTGRGPCGDCRDPRTGKPPYEGGCFRPLVCTTCEPGNPRAIPLLEPEGTTHGS